MTISLAQFLRLCALRNIYLTHMGESYAIFETKTKALTMLVEYNSNDNTLVRIVRPIQYGDVKVFMKGDIEVMTIVRGVDRQVIDMKPKAQEQAEAELLAITLAALRDDLVNTYRNGVTAILF